jgi:pimeloyl-ACP methyl ester carboxylesterase/DNA-binding winged helix-turn-helix (wHTH) protein
LIYRFEDHALDTARRELRTAGAPVHLEPQVFDLIELLLRERDRVVSKDDLIAAVWGGRIVSESTLTSRINAARRALGDSGAEQRLIRTVPRKGVRFVGRIEPASMEAESPAPSQAAQEIRFCSSRDGVRLAYASIGAGPPLLRTGHWLTHLHEDWESPVWRPYLAALAGSFTLVRYDARGTGLSDREVETFSFERFTDDLEAVADAAGLDRFTLLGMSQGCASAIAYAVRRPERVRRLVLYGGFARGIRRRGLPEEIERSDALLTLMRHGWGQENPAFRQIFTTRFVPDGTPEQIQWFNDLQRRSASPENAVRIRRAVDDIDVSELLPRVAAPTLVMHCRDDAAIPFEQGRRLAAAIPAARFVALEGRNHVMLEGDPGWARFFEELRAFVTD